MGPPSSNPWQNDERYNELLNYIIKKTENVESPMNIYQLVKDFKKECGDQQAFYSLRYRILKIRTVIHKIGHIDTNTKVKVLFALSAPVDAAFLKKLRKDAFVEVDEKKQITYYKANDGSLELRGDHSLREKRSLINNYFKNKNDVNAVPKDKEEKEMWNFIKFMTEECENADSPLSIRQLTKDFNNHFGSSRSVDCIKNRVGKFCRKIQKTEFLDTPSKVKQLFGLSAKLDPDYLEKLQKDAVVEVDNLNRITKYTANNGGLTLHGDHSSSTKNGIGQLASKRSYRTLINNYLNNKNTSKFPATKEEKEMGNMIEYITEKCDTSDTPLCITQLLKDFNNNFGISRSCVYRRIKAYCNEIQKTQFLDTHPKVKQLFCLGARLDSDFLKELRKDADVEVDSLNRITEYIADNGRLTVHGDHSSSAKNKLGWIERRKNKKRVKKQCISSGDEYSSEEFDSKFDSDEENNPLDETEDLIEPSNTAVDFDNETPVRNRSPTEMSNDDNFKFDPPTEKSHISDRIEMAEDEGKENDTEVIGNGRIKKSYERLSKRRYSDSEDDSDSHPEDSDDENDDLDKTQDLMEPSNEADDSDNETSVRSIASSGISIDNNFDFNPPNERSNVSEETEMREDDEKEDPEITENTAFKTQISETLPNSNTSSSTSHTPKTSKRKADESAGSTSSKRTKPSSDNKSMNPEGMNDNISHDDLPRIESNPFHEPLGLPNENQKDSDVQQIPKPHPQVIEAPIKEEYEEKTRTSLKMILNAFKSLILSLDTPGLSQLQIELDQIILEAGERSEVSTKEVIMAMNFLIVKLSKHGALKPPEDSISLRDILLMLRTIILNSRFNGLEGISEMLKENIEQLKVLDKKIPASKVDFVLRATLDIICT